MIMENARLSLGRLAVSSLWRLDMEPLRPFILPEALSNISENVRECPS